MRARLGSALAAAALVAAGACNGDEKEKTASELAAEENARVLCERLFSCCTPAELAALPFVVERPPPTLDGCVEYHTRVGLEYVAVTEAEAAAGRVALHTDRSPACVTELREATCSAFHARLRGLHVGDAFALCNPVVVEPLVEDDAACRFYLDCRGGHCALPAGAGTGADAGPEATGTCKALPPAGAACADDACAEGLRCDPDTGKCVKLGEEGDACDADDACASAACRGGKCASPGRCGG
jgi:hypothetical protein